MNERYRYLQDLFDFKKSLDIVSSQLKGLEWDFEGEPLVLKKRQLIFAINSFLKGSKSAVELEYWANLIEMREDIEFDREHEMLINDTIHKLANPELEGQLTNERCKQYLIILEK